MLSISSTADSSASMYQLEHNRVPKFSIKIEYQRRGRAGEQVIVPCLAWGYAIAALCNWRSNNISMPFQMLTRTPSATLPSRSQARAFCTMSRPTIRTTNRFTVSASRQSFVLGIFWTIAYCARWPLTQLALKGLSSMHSAEVCE
jgi:hypothetical protein